MEGGQETEDLVGVSLGPRMCNSIDVYLPVPLSGKFVLRFKYSTKFHSRTGRHIKTVCLYTEREREEGEGEKSSSAAKENAQTKESRSVCRLVRSLVSKMSQPKRIAIIYGFLMRRQSASRPIYMLALYMLLLFLYIHIVYAENRGERARKFGLRFHYSWI